MNKKLLLGVSFLFIFVLLAGCVGTPENGNGDENNIENGNGNEVEVDFKVQEKTINDVKSILSDLIYLNTGIEGSVVYVSGKMDGEYKVLTFIVEGSNVQDIYVTPDEKSILQAPPISIKEMMDELVIAKIQMEEYLKDYDFDDDYDPLEGTNMTVQECLNNEGYEGYIFLYSPSCPHCNNMLPIVDELIAEGYKIDKTMDSSGLRKCLSDLSGYVPDFICNTGNKEANHLGGGLTKEDLIELYTLCGTQ